MEVESFLPFGAGLRYYFMGVFITYLTMVIEVLFNKSCMVYFVGEGIHRMERVYGTN